MTCGASVMAVLEVGTVTVRCTLPKHNGSSHYDDVFSFEWKERNDD